MKLWYQSLTRENLFRSYLGQLPRVIAAIKRPDTVIDVHGITRGATVYREADA